MYGSGGWDGCAAQLKELAVVHVLQAQPGISGTKSRLVRLVHSEGSETWLEKRTGARL